MPLPKTRDGWAALGVAVALAGLGAWQATAGNWIAVATAILGVLAAALGVAVKLGPRGPALVLALLLLGTVGACSPYAAAKRSTWALKSAVQTAGDGLGQLAEKAHADCLATHASATPAYKSCVWPWLGHLQRWQGYGRPAGRTGVATLYGAVRLADAAKGQGKKLDCLGLFAIGGCAVLRGIQAWGHLLPDQGAGVLKFLDALNPSTCRAPPKLRAAAGAVIAGIGLAMEVLAWIRRALKDPAGELFREVDAWLRAPPKDASDGAAALIRKHLPRPAGAPPRP